ncbi:loader of DNA helicase [Synechococcus phage S-H25]|nr:loader of DNA helicase [Synechococcus phage S-H25]
MYKMYLALKQHFTKDSYDYVKYRGKVSASEKSFEERRDRYFFKKLATKYGEKEILNYFVANFISDPRGYIKSFSDDIYTRWRIYQESFSYKFKQDVDSLLEDIAPPYEQSFDSIFTIRKGQHPIILRKYLSQEITLETLVVFEHCLGFVERFDSSLSDPIWKQTRNQIVKYRPFVNIDCKKYRSVILDTIRRKL